MGDFVLQKIIDHGTEIRTVAACMFFSNLGNFFVHVGIIISQGIDWFSGFGTVSSLLGMIFMMLTYRGLIKFAKEEKAVYRAWALIFYVLGAYFTVYTYTFFIKSVLITVLCTVSLIFPAVISVYIVTVVLEPEK
jgi:hypothetical protein